MPQPYKVSVDIYKNKKVGGRKDGQVDNELTNAQCNSCVTSPPLPHLPEKSERDIVVQVWLAKYHCYLTILPLYIAMSPKPMIINNILYITGGYICADTLS